MTELSKKDIKSNFLEFLKSQTNGNISEACLLAGISRQSVMRWRKIDYKFDEAIKEISTDGKENLADIAENALLAKIKDGDTTAIIFTLKTLRRDYYGEFKPPPPKDHSASLITGEKEIAAFDRIIKRYSREMIDKASALTDTEKEEMNSLMDKIDDDEDEE